MVFLNLQKLHFLIWNWKLRWFCNKRQSVCKSEYSLHLKSDYLLLFRVNTYFLEVTIVWACITLQTIRTGGLWCFFNIRESTTFSSAILRLKDKDISKMIIYGT